MYKKHFILAILLVALFIVGITGGNVYPLGHYKDAGGPGTGAGGTAADCTICHDFLNGIYGGGGVYGDPAPPLPPTGYNLRWVNTTINGRTVKFTRFLGLPADGTLADGPAPYDGACEVCHTTTRYYRNNGTGASHHDATNCTLCHPHFLDDITNYFEPRFPGNQAHYTHFDDPKGPQLALRRPDDYCTYYCHNNTDFSRFKDGKPLETTTICDPCHGNYGPFNGVGTFVAPPNPNPDPNSVAYGAKQNWIDAVYEPAVPPETWPSVLKAGKQNWCAGCHDTNYNDSRDSRIYNVSAPNVMGDNVAYGYNVTGHGPRGVTCQSCHDTTAIHTDSNARTYSASLNNYQSGYRLNAGMAIPRHLEYGPGAFDLCFLRCHDYNKVFGTDSSFRDDNRDLYLHETHLGQSFRGTWAWDSDWSGGACDTIHQGEGCDSAMSCTACHNVHGSPCVLGSSIVACSNPLKFPMIRHGELISTPGTQDKVPALQFHWYTANNVPVTDFDSSRWGGLLCSNTNVPFNHVCWGCHSYEGEIKYYRGPCGPKKVAVHNVWTTDTDLGNTPKTIFHPGDPIRYHVSFTIGGTASSYFVQDHGVAQKTDGTGPKHEWWRADTLAPCNTYEWTQDKFIPSTITPPPGGIPAQITISVFMYDRPGGILLSSGVASSPFTVVPLP